MAISNWRRGQLVTLWIGALLAVTVLAVIGFSLVGEATGIQVCLGPCPEPTPAERLMIRTGVGLIAGCVVILVAMLVVTWKWFGARPAK